MQTEAYRTVNVRQSGGQLFKYAVNSAFPLLKEYCSVIKYLHFYLFIPITAFTAFIRRFF